MHLRTYYPTVVLSDIHLGTSHSKTIEVSNFLKSVNCGHIHHPANTYYDGIHYLNSGLDTEKAIVHTIVISLIHKKSLFNQMGTRLREVTVTLLSGDCNRNETPL